MPARPAARRHEFAGLTGSRGLACGAVVVVHTLAATAPTTLHALHLSLLADAAVTYFFALSAFLLALPFIRSIAGQGERPSLCRYGRRRLLRIFPAYIVIFLFSDLAMGAVYVTNAVAQPVRSGAGVGRILGPLRLAEHATLTQNFVAGQMQTGINPAWSLTTELCFYLVLPLLTLSVLSGRHRGGHQLRSAAIPVVILLAVGLVSKVLDAAFQKGAGLTTTQAQFGPNAVAVFSRSLLVAADSFGWGMAAAVLYVWIERGDAPWWTGHRTRAVSGGVLLAAVLVAGTIGSSRLLLSQAAFAIAAGAIITLAVTPADSARPSFTARLMDLRPFHFAGVISLSLYLWHYPVLLVAMREHWIGTGTGRGAMQSVVVVLGSSIVLAWITYELIEAPAMGRARLRPSVAR